MYLNIQIHIHIHMTFYNFVAINSHDSIFFLVEDNVKDFYPTHSYWNSGNTSNLVWQESSCFSTTIINTWITDISIESLHAYIIYFLISALIFHVWLMLYIFVIYLFKINIFVLINLFDTCTFIIFLYYDMMNFSKRKCQSFSLEIASWIVMLQTYTELPFWKKQCCMMCEGKC